MITVADVDTGTALWVGLGLAVACFVLAGMLRGEWAYALGWVIQVAAIGLGLPGPDDVRARRDLRAVVGHGVLPRPQDRARAGRGVRERPPDVTDPLSPTERTTLGRLSEKARTDRRELLDLLDTALVAHVGVDAGGYPLVLPTAFAVDPDGPDRDGTLYFHGSVAAPGWWPPRHDGLRDRHPGRRAGGGALGLRATR